jgi:hypothetical protein
MHRGTWLWVAAVAALAVAASAWTVEEADGSAASPKSDTTGIEALRSEYALMVTECRLTEEQQQEFAKTLASIEGEAAEWDRENGPRIADLERQLGESHGRTSSSKLRQEIHTLREARAALTAPTRLLWLLTAEQRKAWEGFTLWRALLQEYQTVDLTPEQKDRIRAMANQAVHEAPTPPDTGRERGGADRTERDRFDRCCEQIEKEILTDAQRDNLPQKAKTAGERARDSRTETEGAPEPAGSDKGDAESRKR